MSELFRTSSTKGYIENFDEDFPSEMYLESKCSIYGFRCRN